MVLRAPIPSESLISETVRTGLQQIAEDGTRSAGRPLPPRIRHTMEAEFGHDFRSVRVHEQSDAAQSADALAAEAYTVGSDIVFSSDAYSPGSRRGEELLAHELTHVAQQQPSSRQSRGATRAPVSVTEPGDAAEREADAASRPASGVSSAKRRVSPVTGPPVIARDDDDSGSWLSGAWNSVKSAGSSASTAYDNATSLKPLGDALGGGLDWMTKKSDEGNAKMAADAEGQWYSPLAQASSAMNNAVTHGTVGLLKGGGDVVNGLYNSLLHPIDAASGMEGLAEHNLPMVGSMLKAGHGLYDLAAGTKNPEYGDNLGDLANHVLNPLQSSKDDGNYDTDMVLNMGLGAPDAKAQAGKDPDQIRKDRLMSIGNDPWQFGGRVAGNILPMLLGGDLAGEPGAPEAPKVPDAPAAPAVSPMATTIPDMPAAPTVSPMATTIPDMPAAPAVSPMATTIPDMPAAPAVSPMATTIPDMPATPGASVMVDPTASPSAVTQPAMPAVPDAPTPGTSVMVDPGASPSAATQPAMPAASDAPAPRMNNAQIWQNQAMPGAGNVQMWQNILEPPAPSSAPMGQPPSTLPEPPSSQVPSTQIAPTVNDPALQGPSSQIPSTQLAPTVNDPALLQGPSSQVPSTQLAPTVDDPALLQPAISRQPFTLPSPTLEDVSMR